MRQRRTSHFRLLVLEQKLRHLSSRSPNESYQYCEQIQSEFKGRTLIFGPNSAATDNALGRDRRFQGTIDLRFVRDIQVDVVNSDRSRKRLGAGQLIEGVVMKSRTGGVEGRNRRVQATLVDVIAFIDGERGGELCAVRRVNIATSGGHGGNL